MATQAAVDRGNAAQTALLVEQLPTKGPVMPFQASQPHACWKQHSLARSMPWLCTT